MMKFEVTKKAIRHETTPRVLDKKQPRTDIQDMIEMSKMVDMKDYHVLMTIF